MALADNLVAYWSLEEASGTRVDATGRSNDLTPTNTPGNTTGKVGSAVQLTAASSHRLDRASTADVTMGNFDFTISCWAYLDALGAQRYIYSKWSTLAASGLAEYNLLYETSGTRFDFYIAGFGKRVRSDVLGAPAATTWYHIVCTHDAAGDLIAMYVNGTSQGSTATAGSFPAAGTQNLGVGTAKSGEANALWNGRIDELGIWKRLLSGAEITQLYNGGSGMSYADIVAGAATHAKGKVSTIPLSSKLRGLVS